jgi:hypothetical protein
MRGIVRCGNKLLGTGTRRTHAFSNTLASPDLRPELVTRPSHGNALNRRERQNDLKRKKHVNLCTWPAKYHSQ